MTKMLTIPSVLIAPSSDRPLTPAMVTALWVIADHVDRKGIKTGDDAAQCVDIPTKALRGEGRDDNHWLRECLRRLQGLVLEGEYRGQAWGSVMVGEYQFQQGGSLVRIYLLPSAIRVLRAPETFAKVEEFAAYKLDGHARRLYATLCDKKRMTNKHWVYPLDELREIFGIENKRSYKTWCNFKFRVLDPALKQVNDFGTMNVKMTPEKVGRSIAAVRFDWVWKNIDQARETDEENEKADIARRQPDTPREAPPLTEAAEPPRRKDGTEEERGAFVDNLLKANGWG